MSKRKKRAMDIVARGLVKRISESKFLVGSESKEDRWYEVAWQSNRWMCGCPDFEKRRKACKHIYAAMYHQLVQNVALGCSKLSVNSCPKCGKADEVMKSGFRYNKSGPVQRYYCRRCNVKFTERSGFQGMKKSATVVAAALDLFFKGLSLRQIAQHIKHAFGVEVSHVTVRNWVKKYVKLIDEFLSDLKLPNSKRWHADETVIKVNDRHMLIWSLLDSETRMILATHVSKYRGVEEALELLKKGKELAENTPDEIITDGLTSYIKAVEKTFAEEQVIHIQSSLRKGLNNKVERLIKDLKAKSKISECFHSEEGLKTFVDGYRIYHNFVKEHQSLGNKTPAQTAGLVKNKLNWLDLIAFASSKSKNHDN